MNIHNIHVKSNKPQRLYNTGSSRSGSCRSTVLIIVATLIVISYIILKKPDDYLEDPSDQYVVRSIPKLYTKLEGIDAEERDVFQGFRTSFLPHEEIVLARRDTGSKKEFYEGNVTSDIFIWGSTDKQNQSPTRLKRTSRFTFSSQDYPDEHPSQRRQKFESDEQNDAQDNQSEIEEEYESSDTSEQYEDAENLERVVRPEQHVDRGPLDDVVEQIRGQPELEEGESGSSAYLYKPGKNFAGIHAFWKGQGDKETIRNTQANIMRKYMDAEADPCDDFYQYACGNWASLNPIPADKAGYDTFEMLRENLDTVLKDLLEFKNNENVDSKYPGKHLDLQNLQEYFITNIPPNRAQTIIKPDSPFPTYPYGIDDTSDTLGNYEFDTTTPNIVFVTTDVKTPSDPEGLFYSSDFKTKKYVDLHNSPPTKTTTDTNREKKWEKSKENIIHSILNYMHLNVSTNKPNKSEIVYRIRRYLDRELKHAPVQNRSRKYKIHHYFFKNKHDHIKRFHKPENLDTKFMYTNKIDSIKNYHTRLNNSPKTKLKFHKIPRNKRMKIGRKLQMYTNVYKRNIRNRKRRTRNARESTELKPITQSDSSEPGHFTEPTIEHGTLEETPAVDIINNDPAKGDAALKARFLFKSCMNYEILEKRGHQPLLDLLNLLGGWPILDPQWKEEDFDWIELMAKLRLYNNDILISEWVGPDIKNSDEFVIQFDQTSLGLPTRDYFLQDANKVYLEAYKNYLIKIAVLLGGEPRYVKCSADQLLDFEIRLARITSAPEDRRNVSELYRRMPLCKLEKLVPEVKWRRYLSVIMNRDVKSNETVVLFALSYVRHLVQLISETKPSVLANYLLWRFVRHRVNNLDDRFQSAKQQFYFILFGREQAPPRWKNCISQVNSNMGMALGSMFVKKYFDETSKNDTLTMTREIQESFKELLHLTDWIDSKTKKLAAHKVEAMMLRIGYPDFILNKKELDDRYKEVSIHPDKYFENILNILQHLTKMEQSRLGQPVNKTLWNTAPAVVNAYYSRNKNQIMFPAGILQPPFYHRHFPRSLNYGGIGVVIGHEITHGFDDKGRLFDCNGNLHRWWSDSAIDSFHRRAQCLIDQYGCYIVPEVNMKLDGVNTQIDTGAVGTLTFRQAFVRLAVATAEPLDLIQLPNVHFDNGAVGTRSPPDTIALLLFQALVNFLYNVQGENIADNGGVKQAFRAYRHWLQRHGTDGETLPGLNHTHTQLFFLNFAQVWCGAMRPEAMRNKLKTAVHSPGRFRVIGTLSNSHDFAREFRCPPGTPMNPKQKCSVW